jgi:allophanate hydrolase subunit 1
MKIQKEHNIENFEDLRAKKAELQKKVRKKEKKIRKKINKLKSKTTVPMVYDELLSEFELQTGLMQMLPYILKYGGHITHLKIFDGIRNTPWKRFAVMMAGAFGTGLYTYYHLTKKEEQKQKKKESKIKTEKVKSSKKETPNGDLFI